MKYFILAFIIGVSSELHGQSDTMQMVLQPPTTIFGIYDPLMLNLEGPKKHTVSICGDLYTGSNAFTVKFTDNFFNSGFITDDIKNAASDKLSDKNSVGIDLSSSIWFTSKSDKIFGKNSAFVAGIEYDFDESARFTKDLFHFVFYGNEDLQDQTADFTKSGFELTNLAYYKIGFTKLYTGANCNGQFGVNAAFVQGISGININVDKGSVYTAENGLYLDLNYDFTIHTSGSGAPSLDNIRGKGIAVDIYGSIELPKSGLKLNLIANNIGTISWDKNPLSITGDSTFTFEGIDVNNLFNAQDEAVSGQYDSLLDVLGVTKTESPFNQGLPSRLNASITKTWSDKTFFITLGSQYILNVPYTPLIYIEAGKIFQKSNIMLAASAHTGGYGGYNVGLDISKVFFKNYQLRIGSNSLLGLLAPNTFTGAAGFVGLHVGF